MKLEFITSSLPLDWGRLFAQVRRDVVPAEDMAQLAAARNELEGLWLEAEGFNPETVRSRIDAIVTQLHQDPRNPELIQQLDAAHACLGPAGLQRKAALDIQFEIVVTTTVTPIVVAALTRLRPAIEKRYAGFTKAWRAVVEDFAPDFEGPDILADRFKVTLDNVDHQIAHLRGDRRNGGHAIAIHLGLMEPLTACAGFLL